VPYWIGLDKNNVPYIVIAAVKKGVFDNFYMKKYVDGKWMTVGDSEIIPIHCRVRNVTPQFTLSDDGTPYLTYICVNPKNPRGAVQVMYLDDARKWSTLPLITTPSNDFYISRYAPSITVSHGVSTVAYELDTGDISCVKISNIIRVVSFDNPIWTPVALPLPFYYYYGDVYAPETMFASIQTSHEGHLVLLTGEGEVNAYRLST
jgi:hypothetical protein